LSDIDKVILEQDVEVGRWVYKAGGSYVRGWSHRHYFDNKTDGPHYLYGSDDTGKCQKCRATIPESIIALAALQAMGKRIDHA
jgi:hypothetical protein